MIKPRVTYANVVATIAPLLALGGGACAALRLPAPSPGVRWRAYGASPASASAKNTEGGCVVLADGSITRTGHPWWRSHHKREEGRDGNRQWRPVQARGRRSLRRARGPAGRRGGRSSTRRG